MSEINVLVSSNSTPKVKGSSVSNEGNSVTDNSAAMEFAAIFSGWMAQAIGQGQDSGLQSSNPAGKEANSGQTGIQGLEGMLGSLRTIAGLNLGSVTGQNQQGNNNLIKVIDQEISALLSQDNLLGDATDSGIGSGQLQGGKAPQTELDQYKLLITQLLQDMSGEISKISYKSTDIQGILENLSQNIDLKSYLKTSFGVNQSNNKSQALAEVNPQLNLQSSVANSQQLSAESTPIKGIQTIQENDSNKSLIRNPQQQNISGAQNVLLNQSHTNVDELPIEDRLTQAIQAIVKTDEGNSNARSGESKGSFNSNAGSSKISGIESANSVVGNTNISNLTFNSALNAVNRSGETQTIPVWLQVAQGLRDKVLHQLPTVRELSIQLHPAELGQIQISIAWDNGQVHMNIHASESATGQVLQNNFPELREALSQSGIQCGTMQMGYSNSNQNLSQGRNQTFNSNNEKQENQKTDDLMKISDTKEAVTHLEDLEQQPRISNRINVTA